MYQIPQHVLDNLKCSVCDGYLSSTPLMVKPENEQVCGKCFKIIPTEDKEKCLRQMGFEALAEVFIFPCRYNKQGCNYTFTFGNENNHEEKCQYRYKYISNSSSSSRHSYGSDLSSYQENKKKEISYESDDVKAKFSYELSEGNDSHEFKNLTYMLNIQGNYGNTLAIRNDKTADIQNNINLSIEGAVALKNKPELMYSNIKVKSASEDNVYEVLDKKPVQEKRCYNCRNFVGRDAYSCLFGHTSCANCRGSMCIMCVNMLERETKSYCKNHKKGCEGIFRQSDINKHQSNCPYNDHHCPFEHCKYTGTLPSVKSHLKEDHYDKLYFANDVTKNFHSKDDTIVILCYDSVFKCVYYYYKTFVEFYVTYVGSSEEAANYTYEISVFSNGYSTAKRRSKCSSWNDSMLEKGITFDKKDLIHGNDKKLNFEINLKIIHIR